MSLISRRRRSMKRMKSRPIMLEGFRLYRHPHTDFTRGGFCRRSLRMKMRLMKKIRNRLRRDTARLARKLEVSK